MTFGRGLRALSIASAVLITGAFALVFFYAPNDADQGFVQKIFYVHVPMAIVALCGFVAGGIYGIRHLRSGDRADDLRSYVAIHISLVLAVGVLITGSLWARAAWGQWWVWDEPTLVSFLIVFLLYACYQPLRFSIEDPARQARYASVFAIVAGAFVPLNFMAVRMAESLVHPRVLGTTGGAMPGDMRITFLLALAGMACLFVTLWKYEPRSSAAPLPNGSSQVPALPLDDAGPYVAAAYLVFLALILVYVAIMAMKLGRIERDVSELSEIVERRESTRTSEEERV
jgi:heme exporter protein C